MSTGSIAEREIPIEKLSIATVVSALLNIPEVHTATKYLSPVTTVRGTFVGKRDRRSKRFSIALNIGTPNYAERLFIKQCKAAGEPFPVKKVELKFYPKKKK